MVDEPRSPGERLYLVRLACGNGVRKAEAMTDFVVRVALRTGEKYHPNAVSLLERNQQQWRLEDVRAFAAVDPLNRGEIWLSALSETATWPVQESRQHRPVGVIPAEDMIPVPHPSKRTAVKPAKRSRAK